MQMDDAIDLILADDGDRDIPALQLPVVRSRRHRLKLLEAALSMFVRFCVGWPQLSPIRGSSYFWNCFQVLLIWQFEEAFCWCWRMDGRNGCC
jgi:hypothetical protein